MLPLLMLHVRGNIFIHFEVFIILKASRDNKVETSETKARAMFSNLFKGLMKILSNFSTVKGVFHRTFYSLLDCLETHFHFNFLITGQS